MEGVYPVIIDSAVCGKLRVEKEGAYTRFSLCCPMTEKVIRLSVYGEGREGYLGVPLPKEGKLCLDKRFSPSAMRGFPEKIDRCGLAGEKQEEPEENVPEMTRCEEAEAYPDEAQEDGPFWYASTDGALVSRDGDSEMVALPVGDERVPDNIPGQPRIIEGKEYLVYITKDD